MKQGEKLFAPDGSQGGLGRPSRLQSVSAQHFGIPNWHLRLAHHANSSCNSIRESFAETPISGGEDAPRTLFADKNATVTGRFPWDFGRRLRRMGKSLKLSIDGRHFF